MKLVPEEKTKSKRKRLTVLLCIDIVAICFVSFSKNVSEFFHGIFGKDSKKSYLCTMQTRPKIAIIDSNTLSALGLKGMLQNVMPIMTVDIFGSFDEFTTSNTNDYFHYLTIF